MAKKKISALPAATALTGAEELPAVQGGSTKKATAAQIRTYANPIIAGCTVAANAAITDGKNIASVVRTAPGSGEYTITLTANAATKYAPQVSLMSSVSVAARSIGVTKNTSTVWVVTTSILGVAEDNPFSFDLFSRD